MRALLDTCFVSELHSKGCDPGVRRAFLGLPDEDIFLSVITIGEIVKGVKRMPVGRRKDSLVGWLQGLDRRYDERILPIERETVEIWGEISAMGEARGRVLPMADGLIAATALQHGLRIFTRNVDDFSVSGAMITNPWVG